MHLGRMRNTDRVKKMRSNYGKSDGIRRVPESRLAKMALAEGLTSLVYFAQ